MVVPWPVPTVWICKGIHCGGTESCHSWSQPSVQPCWAPAFPALQISSSLPGNSTLIHQSVPLSESRLRPWELILPHGHLQEHSWTCHEAGDTAWTSIMGSLQNITAKNYFKLLLDKITTKGLNKSTHLDGLCSFLQSFNRQTSFSLGQRKNPLINSNMI